MNQQLNSKIYQFSWYCKEERWSSYWHQVNEILKCNPQTILEIGIGDKFLGNYIKNNTTIKYQSLDINPELKPDIISSVEKIPLADNSFDLVCAFEVLEHLPFTKLGQVLSELSRVSKRYIILSLPHWGRHFSLEIRLPFFKIIRWQYKVNLFPIKHTFNGSHYWEIGKKGYSLKKLKSIFKANKIKIIKDYIAFTSPYHHFFILEKVKSTD